MPIIKSAKKRVKVAAKQSSQNAKTRRTFRDGIKAFQTALSGKKDTTSAQAKAFSAIDKAVKKGIISKNRAARKKSQLNAASKVAGTTKAGAKKVAKKIETKSKSAVADKVKKAAPKKTAPKAKAKKPATKKAPAKKK